MEVISSPLGSGMSSLNPNAPMFVPGSYRAVEDFSEEWWALVHSCPWFRDYWLQERYFDPSSSSSFDDLAFLPDSLDEDEDDDVFDEWCSLDFYTHQEVEYKGKELAKVGTMRWQNGRALAQAPRYREKVPKIVKVKVSPRAIQQPK